MPPDGNPTIAVLISCDLTHLGSGLDLGEIRSRLQDNDPSVVVHMVPGLPKKLDDVARIVGECDADKLVLAVGSSAYSRAALQLQARKAGLDPLAIEVVNLGIVTAQIPLQEAATEHAVLVLAAAIAKSRADSGSRPENLKPVVPKYMSRRSLLSLPVLEYVATPGVYPSLCRAEAGCQECVQACPHTALRIEDGEVLLTKSFCTGCGICMSTCPNDAINLAGVNAQQVNAQIASLLAPASLASQPRGILFLCAGKTRALEMSDVPGGTSATSSWLPVEVPCVEMLQPHWLLAPLTQGATMVAVFPCSDNCLAGKSRCIESRVAYSQEILRLLGEVDERILMLPTDEGQSGAGWEHFEDRAPRMHSPPPENQFRFGGRASAILQLSRIYCAAPEYDHEFPESPFGVIEATDGCTLCGSCVPTCPSQALLLEETDERSALTFNSARCIGCGDCLNICPEDQVLSLRRVTSIQCLAKGRTTLRQDVNQRCESCGKPITSEAMTRRIVAILGDEFASTSSIITRYCVDCRGFLS